MGVPVVTLPGVTTVSRGGLSILSNIGLTELVARDAEQYVTLVTALANDHQRLSSLRATLRDRLRVSPLMNAPQFAKDMESAFRQMWKDWYKIRHPSIGH